MIFTALPVHAATADSPVPPKDAQFTIVCQYFNGPEHVGLSDQTRKQMLKSSDLKDWYIIHAEGESTLYYGFYRTIDPNDPKDAREGKRAQADRKKILALKDMNGEAIFAYCLLVEIPMPDPGGPPEWNLANAPADAYWSVQIGAYKDSPDRKRAALDAVKEARARGVEAFYYHGDTISSVCIGAWPRQAVRDENVQQIAKTADPTQPILVTPGPIAGMEDEVQLPTGEKVRALSPKAVVVDSTLSATLQKYPYHLVNGMEIRKKIKEPMTGRVTETIDPSFLVVIPRGKQPTANSSPTPTEPMDVPQPPVVNPPPKKVIPGAGKLKGLGD